MNFKDMPKVELHCHLDGSLSLDFLRETSGIGDENVLLEEVSVPRDYSESLTEYLKKFDLPIACLNTRERLYTASKELLRTASMENVIYMEVRFSPILLEREDLSLRDVTESVIEGLKEGERLYGVRSGLLLCAMRNHSQKVNMRVLSQAKEYLGAGVCGMDLAGDESAYPTRGFADLFKRAKDEGIPFTIHAGECKSADEVRCAISFGAKRIGHGIAMRGDISLQKTCLNKGIGVELCPISNFQTGAVGRGDFYPAREFLDRGILVTVNTDNRTVSRTSLTDEYLFLTEKCAVTPEEICLMQKNAIKASFAPDEVKDELLKKLW